MNNASSRFNLAAYCLAPAEWRPEDKFALCVYDRVDACPHRWSYRELAEQVRRIGGGLAAAGLRRGDRILIRMDNCTEYALCYFAAIGAGFVPIPASSMLTADEVTFLLQDSGAAAVVMSPGLAPPALTAQTLCLTQDDISRLANHGPLVEFAETAPDDPAYLVYTSGTTSKPKGVLHAHRAALGRRPMHDDWYGLAADDVMLHAGAFNWTYTIGTGLTDPWSRGATAAIYTGEKSPDLWPQLIRATGATLFATVPTLYRQILKYAPPGPLDLGLLRNGLSAGESLAPEIAAEWRTRTGTALLEAFGMSEISTYISTAAGTTPRPGSPGRPQRGRRVAILPAEGNETVPVREGETGVIAVHRSDPGFMLGYWSRPDEQAQMMRGDWFITGDLARQDKDGFVYLAGRADEMMNARGFRVSPVEVEAVLSDFPAVAEVGVTACEVARNLSIIVAFVVWKGAAQPDGLLAHARAHLAAYKVPGEIVAVEQLTRSANGKLRRAALCALRTA